MTIPPDIRAVILRWARDLASRGVPWRMYGVDPAGGLDCVGLVHLALRQIGTALGDPDSWTLPLPSDYALDGLAPAAWEDLHVYLEPAKRGAFGVIVEFDGHQQGHGGIMLEEPSGALLLLHARMLWGVQLHPWGRLSHLPHRLLQLRRELC